MKKLIVGIFIVQIIVLVTVGIPAGGAVNAIWKDPASGIVVRQDNPTNTIDSYYRLLDQKAYDTMVLLFSEDARSEDMKEQFKAYMEGSGFAEARLVKLFPSTVTGEFGVVGAVHILENNPEQPVLSILTLKQKDGKWEIVPDINNGEMEDMQQVLEKAVEVCQRVSKDSFAGLNETQKENVKMQAEMGGQYIRSNLDQLNQLLDAVKP
ncbi:hypothetical protein [Dehalobacterium formicoaceticum]|uniref:DUF4878 domain-containing protein n=1 Tax=Dehalobacterium formicoaceticum TaxID=51515 RepID=A0ABT1Y9M1_9FIRM|nr:hypothetical protein [Dehalobacterium formicoaceticum]MCR6546356.1 hypothetical protein [Dehalobacterium formicoaceticum]